MSNEEIYTERQFIESCLPKHYSVKARYDRIFDCVSRIGIDDESKWEAFKSKMKGYFGDRLSEIFHTTCTNHVRFTIYLKYKPTTNA